MTSDRVVDEVISSFCCDKDRDIQHFLCNNAIRFEKSGKSKTYFLFSEERLAERKFALLAYFSVALQVLKVAGLDLSNRKIKELDGFSAKRSGETLTEFPVYLIGQLSKNDTHKDDITGKTIIDHAMSVISAAQEKVGGRIVLVECNNEPHLLNFYTANGFTDIRQDKDKHMQMIRMLGAG